jgi:hypothetical protein
MDYQHLLSSILSNFAISAEFTTLMREVFGQNINTETLQQQWLNQNCTLPTVEIVNTSVINGALGAYSPQTDKIYLSQELIDSNDTDLITRVLLEEYGHHVDALLNVTDTIGDEGELFSAIVGGVSLSETQLNAILQENDTATITIQGEALEIEQANFSNTTTLAVATNPSSVTVGDFNGDGKLDLAVANFNSNNVSIRFG